MKVFVTGASGFVGNEVVKELLARGHAVKALVRPGSEKKLEERERCELVLGDCPSTPKSWVRRSRAATRPST